MDDLDLGATIRGFIAGQKVFNRYVLVRQLGRGGMGVVWLARDESLEREVAIKMLPEIVANDPVAVKELKRETAKSQRLSHPRILRIYDFVETGPLCGITMEYVEGGTLAAKRLEQPGEVFSPVALGKWVRQLCEALAYAHGEVQIVHRDLKPANLMIDRAGDLKVADFGIAASVSDSVSRVSQQAGSSGTPVYMSPQQMMGEKPAVTDDIYAIGATLYELLTGKPPFYSGNVLMQVQNKVPPSLAERRGELGLTGETIPPEWEATIAACLAKEPKDRPQSAGEVLQGLRIAEGGLRSAPAQNRNAPADDADKTDKVGQDRRAGRDAVNAKSKMPAFAGIAAAVLVLAGAGFYFGAYAPEQKRLAEIARLEAQGRAAEAAQLRDAQEKAEAETARLAAARGGIVVRTNPAGAEVRVGAVALDKSPLTLKDQKLGKYPVRIRLDGYEDWDGEVEVKENDFTDLDIALVRSTGRVVLTGTAGADVVSGGTRLGTLPLTLDRVPTGAVKYTVSLKGHKPAEVTGEIARNAELRLSAMLEPQLYPQSGQPFENTLGQKFVPVPGTNVLFSIWETRVQDFEAFVRETAHDATQGMYSNRGDGWKQQGDTWRSPGFPQGSTHPVVGVNQADAQAFCEWLTKRERAAGRLEANQSYRLPTDAEWDAAVGRAEFPWGNQWPPPRGAGNYADEAAKRGRYKSWTIISGYDDGYDATAPVGSFAANAHGLYDLGGNVWEYVNDRAHGLRGASFSPDDRGYLASSYRLTGGGRYNFIGFRVVCAVGSVEVAGSANPLVALSAVASTSTMPVAGQKWTMPDLALDLMPIASGTFTMGGAGNPTQQVTLTKPFWLGATEVSQGQWQAIMGNSPSQFKGSNLPVEQVSWAEVMEFCRKLTERERSAGRLPAGYVYTLPTEAQWEYACRAGTTGDYAGDLNAMGWYDANSGGSTKPVGTKQANAWGLHDMHGNVWEWCLDWHANYPGGSVTDPTGPPSGSLRVSRGGSWGSTADGCRSADRGGGGPGGRGNGLGFRLALSSVR
jgi:formylglycine-generating enzyme required for sulfatase activity